MNETFLFILLAAVCFLIGAFIGDLVARLKQKAEAGKLEERLKQASFQEERLQERFESALEEREVIRKDKDFLNSELVRRNAEFENLEQKNREQKAEVEKLQEKFTKEFENLANKILDEKSAKFTKQNKENLETILNPLQEKIKTFEKRVEDTHKESIDRHAMLRQQIIGLKELNEQMSKEAVNLTKALKGDSKTQGDWGEIQLEILLEKSGLRKGVHFTTQGGYRDEKDRLKKPDFIINLPDNRHLVIDSKVSLTAYEAYYNGEDDTVKAENLKKHLSSIKKHIKDLGEKEYSELYGINTPDYVLMFVPIEYALMLALSENNKLYLDALDKNVVLVSVSTLLATLSTVSSIWRQEEQKHNVIEIARQAGALYDKFEGLVKDLTGVGKKIDAAKMDYSAAMNKLVEGRGNLITSVEKLKKLGAKAKKSLPENILKRASEDEEE